MLDLLSSSIKTGTGRQALLTVDAYGKTGTTQDSRDALFIGFARDLVVGVWVGNDDNTPNPGLSGGGVPARIWRAFMQSALDIPPVAAPVVEQEVDPDAIANGMEEETLPIEGDPVGDIIQGMGLDLRTGEDGSITVGPGRRRPDRASPPPEDRRPPDERDGEGEE